MYAAWGKLAGFSTSSLRMLSVLFSAATLILLYWLYSMVLRRIRPVIAGMAVLLLNPYLIGLGFYVFTDIPALFFIVLTMTGLLRSNRLLIFLGTACSLLIRQYSVFITMAALAWLAMMHYRKDGSRAGEISALLLGLVPISVMMFLWKGMAPPSGCDIWIIPSGSFYSPGYLVVYIAFIAAYSLPLIVWHWRRIFSSPPLVLSALVISLGSFLFPVRASEVTVRQTGITTVGLLHAFLDRVLASSWMLAVLLWLLCFAGITVLLHISACEMKKVRSGSPGYSLFLTLAILSFIVIMPLSYQVWEKYLLMVMPMVVLRLLQPCGSG